MGNSDPLQLQIVVGAGRNFRASKFKGSAIDKCKYRVVEEETYGK